MFGDGPEMEMLRWYTPAEENDSHINYARGRELNDKHIQLYLIWTRL